MVTKHSIEDRIKAVTYQIVDLPEGPRMTLCFITMQGGFVVTGQSSCIDTASFNKQLGEQYSFEQAFGKLWELEGYRIREGLEPSHETNRHLFGDIDQEESE